MPKDKHNPEKRKTYQEVVKDLESKKGTTQHRIVTSRQAKAKKTKYSEADLIKRTAKRLKKLFGKGGRTFKGVAERAIARRRAREKK